MTEKIKIDVKIDGPPPLKNSMASIYSKQPNATRVHILRKTVVDKLQDMGVKGYCNCSPVTFNITVGETASRYCGDVDNIGGGIMDSMQPAMPTTRPIKCYESATDPKKRGLFDNDGIVSILNVERILSESEFYRLQVLGHYNENYG